MSVIDSARSLSLVEAAKMVNGTLHGDGAVAITGVASLHGAKMGDISFLASRGRVAMLANTQASCVLLLEQDRAACPVASIVVKDSYVSYARIATYLYPTKTRAPGIHPSAVIAKTAVVARSATVAAHSYIAEGAVVGERVYIGPNSLVDEDSKIGDDSVLVANVTLCHRVSVGQKCIVHPGVVIGADGFGFAHHKHEGWIKIPQIGSVRIGDNVEIGANTTIDRGSLEDTVISSGVKLDNQIQIAHNVEIGKDTAIAGCVGIAGSSKIGRACQIGGGCLIAGHIEIADGVILSAASGVKSSITATGYYSGAPAVENRAWKRNLIHSLRLDHWVKRIRRLEQQIADSKK